VIDGISIVLGASVKTGETSSRSRRRVGSLRTTRECISLIGKKLGKKIPQQRYLKFGFKRAGKIEEASRKERIMVQAEGGKRNVTVTGQGGALQ